MSYNSLTELENLKFTKISQSKIEFSGIEESIEFKFSSDKGILEVERAIYKSGIEVNEIPVSSIKPAIIGNGSTQRFVYHFLDKQFKGNHGLRAGITVHAAESQWSSLPHDFELNLEVGFEEMFFYGLDSKTDSGAIQVGKGVWQDFSNVDNCWLVKDREHSVIPMGYHPVVGLPGTIVSYCWAYIAKHPHWEKVK
jgi:5-deoxy-D-glucuronate isomerase